MRTIVAREPGPLLWFIILVALLILSAWNFAQGSQSARPVNSEVGPEQQGMSVPHPAATGLVPVERRLVS